MLPAVALRKAYLCLKHGTDRIIDTSQSCQKETNVEFRCFALDETTGQSSDLYVMRSSIITSIKFVA